VRKGDDTLAVLHAKKPASRNWNSNRWRIGYENVFVTRPTELEADDASTDDE